ncbi:peptidase M14 carboxypeptidase A [Streptomyces sp. 604F]|uniref:M14 family zinc carboxypeptidase n=1 Tax=Streptomyces TaxID=1883 RepID=UPI0013970E5E|nr:M14 family zinc carboxypeptidase [Streptomyces sp. 604F]MBP3078108.1 peptidase M14 carboxypeptidase A [Streptomyces sp. 604F]QHV86779.1 peptidase M14 [Streptomyces sp. 604F]
MTVSRRRSAALVIAAALLASPLAASPAAATPPSPLKPGPWVCEGEPVKLNRLTSNAELSAELRTLAKRHPRTLDVETIGRSVDGRPLYTATAGTGPRKLLILTQMHGDEPLGTEAALRMLKKVAGPGRAARELREEVTIKVVPRVNPDGWERYHDPDFREGVDPRLNSRKVDLNRMFGPAPEYDIALAPEAAAVHGVVDGFAPDLVLDYHHQVTYATPDGRMVTMSVLWSTHPDVAPEVAADGKRAAAVVGDALADDPRSNVTLYPRSDTASTARNGLGLDGYPTLLLEQRGQQEAGQKGAGPLIREARTAMESIAGSLADGSFATVDPARADLLPERGAKVDPPC